MRALLKYCSLIIGSVLIYPCLSLAATPIYLGIQPTNLTVSYGATQQPFTLQFYLVNNTTTAVPISNFNLTASNAPSPNPVTILSQSNDCQNSIPAQGPSGVCNVFFQVSAAGNQPNANLIAPITYTFSMQYGARKTTLQSQPFTFQFATGQQNNSLSRTITFNNQCNQDVWIGIASGATNSIHPDPSTSPLDLKSCLTDSDCYPGSKCILVQSNPSLSHCFWENPVPNNAAYHLPASNGTNTVVFPVYDNGTDIVWNGGITARTGCTGSGCDTGDCGGGTGACPLGKGFSAPVSTAEFTLESINPVVVSNTPNGNTDVDTYDVTVINGLTIPLSMSPTNGTWGGSNNPYTCGTPGAVNANSPLGGCAWSALTPPSNDYVWVTYESSPISCSSDGDCSSLSGSVCGSSFNGAAAQGSQITKTCGFKLGYWTADAICAKDPLHSSSTFPCTNTVQGSLTLADLLGCSKGELKESCYSNGASDTCCGCADWGTLGAVVPSTTQLCNAHNDIWKLNALPTLTWLKLQCPTVYTYPFDDASSTFTCQVQNQNHANVTNYTVTFCPST